MIDNLVKIYLTVLVFNFILLNKETLFMSVLTFYYINKLFKSWI